MKRLLLTIACIVGAAAAVAARLVQASVDTVLLPATTASDSGVINQAGHSLLHSYAAFGAVGANTFLGMDSGNFTMGGPQAFHGSYNTGVGYATLLANTSGFDNTAVGESSLKVNTTGVLNTTMGAGAMFFNTVGYFNTALGGLALWDNTTGAANTVIGVAAGQANSTGSQNTMIGVFAGLPESFNWNVSGGRNVWIGIESGPGTPDQLDNTVAVGHRSHPTESNQVVVGTSEMTSTVLFGTISVGSKPGVTAGGPGQTCTITEVTGGLITGATCS